jgi:hypothetical protein
MCVLMLIYVGCCDFARWHVLVEDYRLLQYSSTVELTRITAVQQFSSPRNLAQQPVQNVHVAN